jgi:threonine dehydratase
MVERTNATTAEGVATGTAFELPQRIMAELLTDFVLVEDRELLAATRLMIEKTRTLVEPAGAAPLAAALNPTLAPRLRGRRVALICSGANISPAQLAKALASPSPRVRDA